MKKDLVVCIIGSWLNIIVATAALLIRVMLIKHGFSLKGSGYAANAIKSWFKR